MADNALTASLLGAVASGETLPRPTLPAITLSKAQRMALIDELQRGMMQNQLLPPAGPPSADAAAAMQARFPGGVERGPRGDRIQRMAELNAALSRLK